MCTRGPGSLLSRSLHNPPHLNPISGQYFYLNCNRSRPFLFLREEWLGSKWNGGADGIFPSDAERKVTEKESYEHFIIVTSLLRACNGEISLIHLKALWRTKAWVKQRVLTTAFVQVKCRLPRDTLQNKNKDTNSHFFMLQWYNEKKFKI